MLFGLGWKPFQDENSEFKTCWAWDFQLHFKKKKLATETTTAMSTMLRAVTSYSSVGSARLK